MLSMIKLLSVIFDFSTKTFRMSFKFVAWCPSKKSGPKQVSSLYLVQYVDNGKYYYLRLSIEQYCYNKRLGHVLPYGFNLKI